MTTEELLRTLQPLSRATVFRDLFALKIRPLGFAKQRPQQWPDDAAARIRARRGLPLVTIKAPTDTAAARLVTLPELRNERRKSISAKAGSKKR